MNTHVSLSLLIITGAFLSAQATTAQNPQSIAQESVANNTLKAQVSVVDNLTNFDPIAIPTVQIAAQVPTSQTAVFLSDVAGIRRDGHRISALPAAAVQSEVSVEIPVPLPLTQTIKGQIPVNPAQPVRITPTTTTTMPAVSLPIIKPFTPGTTPATTALIYPLTSPAPITSRFGWRTHPLTGNRRFHSGLDIGAPSGAPVVAAGSGTVIAAGWNGGYGKAVIIQHSDRQQTLYGHLSEVSVQAGQTIAQGTVIGLVGSTGNSTGPHLHFESRTPTAGAWTAIDPSQEIQYAVDILRRSMPYARKDLPPGI